MDKSNSLSYGHIRKKSNKCEDIFTPSPWPFLWAAGNPPEGVSKYKNFFFWSMLYLLLIIDVIETFQTIFFYLKVRENAKIAIFYPPLIKVIVGNIWNEKYIFRNSVREKSVRKIKFFKEIYFQKKCPGKYFRGNKVLLRSIFPEKVSGKKVSRK